MKETKLNEKNYIVFVLKHQIVGAVISFDAVYERGAEGFDNLPDEIAKSCTSEQLGHMETLLADALQRRIQMDNENVKIIVNGREQVVGTAGPIRYKDLVEMAKLPADAQPSIAYGRGPKKKREGILAPGESTVVVEGMHFNVYETGNA